MMFSSATALHLGHNDDGEHAHALENLGAPVR